MVRAIWARRLNVFRWLTISTVLPLAVAGMAACGSETEAPAATAPEPRAPQATAAPASDSGRPASASEATAPSAMLAPTFELPNAAGETVSLGSYAGDKNVVLVFYRGFW